MAPFPLPMANGSSSTSANTTLGSPPRPIPCQPVDQNQWGPDSISNIAFGLVMVFVSLFAIYQSSKQNPRGSRGQFGHVDMEVLLMDVAQEDGGGMAAGAENEAATWGPCSERRKSRGELVECVCKDEEDGGEFSPRVGHFTRTNTDVTLIGGNEESSGSAFVGSYGRMID